MLLLADDRSETLENWFTRLASKASDGTARHQIGQNGVHDTLARKTLSDLDAPSRRGTLQYTAAQHESLSRLRTADILADDELQLDGVTVFRM